MLRKVGGWWLAAFVVALGVGEAALKAMHNRWPQSVVMGLGALVAAAISLAAPVRDALSSWWAKQLTAGLERRAQQTALVRDTAPGRRRLQRVREFADARDVLGIHQAIPLPEGADPTLSRDLPLYIPRDVHVKLTTWITAKENSKGFLLLVGPAGSGKTRCLYEALKDKVPDAQMLIPQGAAQLEAVDTNAGSDLLIVWLNEIYDLLVTGELTIGLVRRLLNCRRPILIVGTIWTSRYVELTTGELNEISRDVREILTVLCQTERVVAGFSDAELERAKSLQERDPRLSEALATGSPDVIGTLAAKPRLMAHWDDPPDPYGHAVLHAAILARQVGHLAPIPVAVLEPIATALLSPGERARAAAGWFETAIAAECSPLPSLAIAPLEAQADVPGVIDGYSPHDILLQDVQVEIRDSDIRKFINYATPFACLSIGLSLMLANREPSAALAAAKKAAAELDNYLEFDPDGEAFRGPLRIFIVGVLFECLGDEKAATEAFLKAVKVGPPELVEFSSGMLLIRRWSNAEEAKSTYRILIDSGHFPTAAWAAKRLGDSLRSEGDTEGAKAAYKASIASGNLEHTPWAALYLGDIYRDQGDVEEAKSAYGLAIASDNASVLPWAALALGDVLSAQHDMRGAKDAYQLAIDSGDIDGVSRGAIGLGKLLLAEGQVEKAAASYLVAIKTNHDFSTPLAMTLLGHLLREQGDIEGAKYAYRCAVEISDKYSAPLAAVCLADMLQQEGDTTGARSLCQKAIDSGHAQAAALAISVLKTISPSTSPGSTM